MKHIFVNNNSEYTFLLLHGTGGDEHSLLNLGKMIDRSVNLLSIRGNISEQGHNRFFKRHGIGSYDIESLEFETNNLVNFLNEAAEKYNIDKEKFVLIGFSNGANIIQSILQLHGRQFYAGILLSPSYLQPNKPFKDLDKIPLFISVSQNDPFMNADEAKSLVESIKKSNGKLEVFWFNEGHTVTNEVLSAVVDFWLNIKDR